MAVKAINNSAGPNRLMLTLFMFSAFPRITDKSAPTTIVVKRGEAIKKAIKEVRKL